jgi:type VI protein secretion system component VasF
VPRRTAEDRQRASLAYHAQQLADARAAGNLAAALDAAVRWFQAAVRLKAISSPAEADGLYRHAASQLAAYAETLLDRKANPNE